MNHQSIMEKQYSPSKILLENKLEMLVCSALLNKLSFDSKSTSEYCIKIRTD